MRSDCLVFCWFVTKVYCFCSQIMTYSYVDFESISAKMFACLAVFLHKIVCCSYAYFKLFHFGKFVRKHAI